MTMDLKTSLLSIVFTILTSSCSPTETHSAAIRTSQADHLPSAIPTLNLVEIPVSSPTLIEDLPPEGWRLSRGANGGLSREDGRIILEGTRDRPLQSVRRAPEADDLLVYFGSGHYGIYAPDGALVAEVPLIHSIIKDASVVSWRWKDAGTLVGVTELSPPVERPQYPDADVLPEATLLFLYQPYEDPITVYHLRTEQPPPGTVIRLEGVTGDGMLQLGAVEPNQYFGGPASKILGVFDAPTQFR
ncbi:hypothetical protein ACW7GZ_13675 [Luteimonas sp. A537]